MTKAFENGTGGLVLIATATPSAASNVTFTNLTAGKRYRLMSSLTSSANGNNIGLRFRENTTDKATNYMGAGWYATATTGATGVYTLNSNNRVWLTGMFSTIASPYTLDIYLHSSTTALWNGMWFDVGNNTSYYANGYNSSMSNVNGISIYPESGTFTGTIKLYEYR